MALSKPDKPTTVSKNLSPHSRETSSRLHWPQTVCIILFSLLFYWSKAAPENPVLTSNNHLSNQISHYPYQDIMTVSFWQFGNYSNFPSIAEDTIPSDYWNVGEMSFLQLLNEYAAIHHLVIYNPDHLKGCAMSGTLRKRVSPNDFVNLAINGCLKNCIHAELKHDTIFLKPATPEAIEEYEAWLKWQKKHS